MPNTRPLISTLNADVIERLIDVHGLAAVLHTTKRICEAKAEHIAEQNPNDEDIKTWEQCAGLIDLAQDEAEELP
jgi:hypothetical protein